MKTRPIAALAALLALCSGTYVLGQQNAPFLTPEEFSSRHSAAELGGDAIGPLMDAFTQLPGNAPATKQAARIAFVDARKGNTSTSLTIITMQNQKLIEQNSRVIELLEQIAAEKKTP